VSQRNSAHLEHGHQDLWVALHRPPQQLELRVGAQELERPTSLANPCALCTFKVGSIKAADQSATPLLFYGAPFLVSDLTPLPAPSCEHATPYLATA
jgi:hypothetical protein